MTVDRLLDAVFTVIFARTKEGSVILKTNHGKKLFAYCCDLLKGTEYEIIVQSEFDFWDDV